MKVVMGNGDPVGSADNVELAVLYDADVELASCRHTTPLYSTYISTGPLT